MGGVEVVGMAPVCLRECARGKKKQTKRHAFLEKGQSGLFLLPVDSPSHSGNKENKKKKNTLAWVTHQALKGD